MTIRDEINPDVKKKIADKMKYHLLRAEQLTTSMQYAQSVSLFIWYLIFQVTENTGLYQPKVTLVSS